MSLTEIEQKARDLSLSARNSEVQELAGLVAALAEERNSAAGWTWRKEQIEDVVSDVLARTKGRR